MIRHEVSIHEFPKYLLAVREGNRPRCITAVRMVPRAVTPHYSRQQVRAHAPGCFVEHAYTFDSLANLTAVLRDKVMYFS
jgi:hypothetical protein